MELEVLNPRGLPQKAVVSISVAGTRRQVPLSALDRPLRFPGRPEDVSQIKVDVLSVMGSCRLPYEPSVQKYTVPLDAVSTEVLEKNVPDSMELDLIVRCCDPETGLVSPSKEDSDAYRKKKEAASSDYLEEHGLVSFMQFLLTSLMQDKPTDPYIFLHKQIARRIAAKAAATGNSEQADVYSLLDRLSPTSACKCPVEDVERLEREAVQAAQQLRSDNASLRQTALQLKDEYEKLMKESYSLQGRLDVKRAVKDVHVCPTVIPFNRYYNRFVGRQCGRNYWNSLYLRFDSYRPAVPSAAEMQQETAPSSAATEIQSLQDEVGFLAKENAKLVADLARGREMIETVRDDILLIRKSVLDA